MWFTAQERRNKSYVRLQHYTRRVSEKKRPFRYELQTWAICHGVPNARRKSIFVFFAFAQRKRERDCDKNITICIEWWWIAEYAAGVAFHWSHNHFTHSAFLSWTVITENFVLKLNRFHAIKIAVHRMECIKLNGLIRCEKMPIKLEEYMIKWVRFRN